MKHAKNEKLKSYLVSFTNWKCVCIISYIDFDRCTNIDV